MAGASFPETARTGGGQHGFLLGQRFDFSERFFDTDMGLMPKMAAGVGMAVYGMLLVEQVYRNKSVQERWAIKFACLGIEAVDIEGNLLAVA